MGSGRRAAVADTRSKLDEGPERREMTRGQRRAHMLIWAVLAVILAVVLIFSLPGGPSE